MEESGPHKQSILRNKEVPKKNAPRKPRDVTRPAVMVKRLGFRGTLPVKYKIDFWNNPITASILVWNQVVLNQSQQLGYLNSKLMLSWNCPFNVIIYVQSDWWKCLIADTGTRQFEVNSLNSQYLNDEPDDRAILSHNANKCAQRCSN